MENFLSDPPIFFSYDIYFFHLVLDGFINIAIAHGLLSSNNLTNKHQKNPLGTTSIKLWEVTEEEPVICVSKIHDSSVTVIIDKCSIFGTHTGSYAIFFRKTDGRIHVNHMLLFSHINPPPFKTITKNFCHQFHHQKNGTSPSSVRRVTRFKATILEQNTEKGI